MISYTKCCPGRSAIDSLVYKDRYIDISTWYIWRHQIYYSVGLKWLVWTPWLEWNGPRSKTELEAVSWSFNLILIWLTSWILMWVIIHICYSLVMLQYARHTAVQIKCLIACKDQIIDHVSSQPEFVTRNDSNWNDEESFHVNQTNDTFSG